MIDRAPVVLPCTLILFITCYLHDIVLALAYLIENSDMLIACKHATAYWLRMRLAGIHPSDNPYIWLQAAQRGP